MTIRYTQIMLLLISCFTLFPAQAQQTLNILNWGEYIDPDVLSAFEQANDVTINYQEFDSSDEFSTAFFENGSQFDLIFPSSTMLNVLASNDLIIKLDKKKLTHFKDYDPTIMAELDNHDKGNQYGMPYMWGTTGIGVNTVQMKRLGLSKVQDSWSLIFDEGNRQKIKSCGFALVNERDEIFAPALLYLGYSVNTTDKEQLQAAGELIKAVVKDANYLHTSQHTTDLAEDKLCVAVGYSGDILADMEENKKIAYYIPVEGAAMWFDVMAIPKNSANKDLAYAFINFISTAETAAQNSNFTAYPTPIMSAKPFVDEDILTDPAIYPTADVKANLQTIAPQERAVNNRKHRLWVKAICQGGKWCTVPLKSFF